MPKVEAVESATFQNCRDLTYVDLPAIKTIGELNTFSSCDNLAYIGLGSGLNKLQGRVFSSSNYITICYGESESDFKTAINDREITLVEGSSTEEKKKVFDNVAEALEFIGLTEGKYTILPYGSFPADPVDEQDAKIANPVTRWVLSW